MEPSTFDPKISELEKQLENLRRQMDDAERVFTGAVIDFARSWAREETERSVVAKPDIARGMGPEAMRKLKAELGELIKKYDDLVREDLQSEYYWPHRNSRLMPEYEAEEWRSKRYGRPLGTKIDEGIRRSLGRVGELLRKHRLAEPFSSADPRWGVDRWHEEGKHTRLVVHEKHKLDLPTELQTAHAKYAELAEIFLKVYEELGAVRHQKAQAEAKKLWEEA
jgi:hypothetical protein